MKKLLAFISLCIIPVFFVACGNKKSNSKYKEDYAIVYNQTGKKVVTLTEKKDIAYLSKTAGNLAKSNTVKLPKDAKLTYHYELHQIKKDLKIDLKIYEKDSRYYAELKNLPLLDKLTFELTKDQADILNNPKNMSEK